MSIRVGDKQSGWREVLYASGTQTIIKHNNAWRTAALKQPRFELIEIEGAAYVWPRGINNAGDISGHLVMESENGQFGFIRRGDQVTLLSVPDAIATRAWGIDNEGRVAGHFYDSSEINAGAKGFIYEDGQYTTLIHPEAAYFGGTQAVGINAGRVVGWFFDSASRIHGFLYVNGRWTQLDYPGSSSTLAFGINSAGRIVGSWQDREGSHGFSYQNGQYQEIMFPRPGAADTNLLDCNSDTIVGATGGICEWEPFLLRRDRFTLLDLPGVFAYGINDSGLIVGDYGRSKGFVAKASAFFSKGDDSLLPVPSAGRDLTAHVADQA